MEVTIGYSMSRRDMRQILGLPGGSGLPSVSRDATAVVEGRGVTGEAGGDRARRGTDHTPCCAGSDTC